MEGKENKEGIFKDISDTKTYPGISIYETDKITGGVTIPGVGIFVGDMNDLALIQHEYEHYSNYKFLESILGNSVGGAVYHSFICFVFDTMIVLSAYYL